MNRTSPGLTITSTACDLAKPGNLETSGAAKFTLDLCHNGCTRG